MGVYISGHPLESYMNRIKSTTFNTGLLSYYDEDEDGSRTYTEIKNDMSVSMCGVVLSTHRINTRSGQTMLAVTLEDLYGQLECIVFPKNYDKLKTVAVEEAVVVVSGRLQIKENEVKILAEKMEPVEEEQRAKPADPGARETLGLILPDSDAVLNDVFDVLTSYRGDIPVIINRGGKNYTIKDRVRKCEGLKGELSAVIGEKNVVFFMKKQ